MSSEKGYAYDVFVSYSHKDEEWVTRVLLPHLEQANLRVCVDYRDFHPGAPSVKEMRRAVVESHRTLLVLTPNYLESAWSEFEYLMLQTIDPANRKRRLIPLFKERCDLPLEIDYLTYVDFTRPELDRQAIAWTQLLTALGAPPVQKLETPTRVGWRLVHPYPMPPNFTGRDAERLMLSHWLNEDLVHPLLILRALGGFGKSALAWHWLLHDVDPTRWPRVVWWGFYEDRNCESFLRNTLEYLGVDPRNLGPRQQANTVLRLLHQQGTLLILDGFERTLRAYSGMMAAYQGDDPFLQKGAEGGGAGQGNAQLDCISPIAEHFLRSIASLPDIQSKVMLTTRLPPRALKAPGGEWLLGCCEKELIQMQPADAVAFFRAQGIRGGRAEIEAACAPYGYHPLSLRLLAGLIARDPQQPGDIAAARRLDVSGDLVQRQHHVLEQAYENLTPDRRELLGQIACFRGAVRYEALAALAETQEGDHLEDDHESRSYELDTDLRDLVARGLLHHDLKTNRYDLHPIVRRYAYDRLGDKEGTHSRLHDYFAAVPEPDRVEQLEDLAPVIELYHHTVGAGRYDEAWLLYRDRLWHEVFYRFGAYYTQIELLTALLVALPSLSDESAQAHILNELAGSYDFSGQPRRASALLGHSNALRERMGEKRDLAVGLTNLASLQISLGELHPAKEALIRSIELRLEAEQEQPWNKLTDPVRSHPEFDLACTRETLGSLFRCLGQYDRAHQEFSFASHLFSKLDMQQSLGSVWAERALLSLAKGNSIGALEAGRKALALVAARPLERDFVRAHWLLGAAHRASADRAAADRHLNEALTRCRGINLVEMEADILLDLARLRAEAGEREEALCLAEEAWIIAERSEYVLQGANVRMFLARMAWEAGDREAALDHAREARRLATCDGPPDYTYKVAYEEAGVLLEELTRGGWRSMTDDGRRPVNHSTT